MSTIPEICEHSYRRGLACKYQVRTNRGRLIVHGNAVGAVEHHMKGARVLWIRERGQWYARQAGDQ